jgi:hypothetical protein
MTESIAQKLIDAAEKLIDFEAGHDPYYWNEKDIEEYSALEEAFKQLAQEVEDELSDLRSGQTIVDPQFKDRYVELVADLFKHKERESLYKIELETEVVFKKAFRNQMEKNRELNQKLTQQFEYRESLYRELVSYYAEMKRPITGFCDENLDMKIQELRQQLGLEV